jgi:apolipoprotein N-acyltransferase
VNRRAALVGGAILTGVLQALLPYLPAQSALALVVMVPLFVALERASADETIVAAIAYALVLGEVAILPWLGPALGRYFDLSWARSQTLAAAIVAVLALLHGGALGAVLALRPPRTGSLRVLWYAALWVTWEALRPYVPPYFPAAALGASLERSPALLQVASVTGMGGVTAVVVAANAGIAALVAREGSRAGRRRAFATGIALAALATAWGAARLATPLPAPPDAPVVLAVDLVATEPAASTLDALIAATPIEGTRATADRPRRGGRPDVVLWPESAINLDLARDRAAWRRLGEFVERADTTLVTGGLTFAIAEDGRSERFNSLHVLRPRFGLHSYHKRLLVPLAESWPSFLGAPPAALEPVVAGSSLPVLDAGGWRFGPLICFEIADAASARALARGGASFLVNVTNDAWFRRTEAPHLRWARIRAIESGLPVVRVANAGTSVIFDPMGREVATSEPAAPVGLLEAAIPPAVDTVYVATGEVFLPACATVVALGVVASIVVGVRRRRALVSKAVAGDGAELVRDRRLARDVRELDRQR